MSDLAFPSDERSRLNLAPIIRGRWTSGTQSLSAPSDSCSCDISSSPSAGMSSTTSPPYTTTTSSLPTSPSFTSSSFSLLSSTNSFTNTPLDSRSSSTQSHLSSTSSPIPPNGRLSLAGNTVCLGHGLDASVDGLLATIVLFGLIGLLLWVRCALSSLFFLNIFCLSVIICVYSAPLPPNIRAPRMVRAGTVRTFPVPESLVLIPS